MRPARGTSDYGPRRRVLFHNHHGRRRFVARHKRHRALRGDSTRVGAGAAQLSNARQLAAGDAFREQKNRGENWPAPRTRFRPEYPSQAGVYAADKNILAVNRSEAEDRPAVLADPRCRIVSRYRFRRVDVRRQHEVVGPRDLADVRRRDARRDRFRSRVVSASSAAANGEHSVTSEQAITFLATPWTVVAAVIAWLIVAGFSFVAWRVERLSPSDRPPRRSCGSRFWPSWASSLISRNGSRRFRPTEKPTIAVLSDSSTSMTTRDVWDLIRVPALHGSPSPAAKRRAADAQRHLASRSRAVHCSECSRFAPVAGSGTDLNAPLLPWRWRNFNSLGGVVLVSDGDWNEGPPPVQAAVAAAVGTCRCLPCRSAVHAAAGCRAAQPRRADVRHRGQVGADSVYDRKLAAARVRRRRSC